MRMQNLGGQKKSIMVFSEVAYCEASLRQFHSIKSGAFLKSGDSSLFCVYGLVIVLRSAVYIFHL